MDQALQLVFTFRLDGNDVASVAHGDDVFLQDLGIRSADIVLQGFLDAAVCLTDLPTHLGKLAARLICDHILRQDRPCDAILQISVGQKAQKDLVQRGVKLLIVFDIINQHARRMQQTCDLQQLTRGEHCTLCGALCCLADVLDRAKRGGTLGIAQALGIGGAP